ncbi:MAG: NAD(P)H-dependent oxidoreductase subunit E [bacterium]
MNLDLNQVDTILERYPRDREQLIQVLQDVNHALNYLPAEALRKVALGLEVSLADVYAVARYYAAFSLEPRGRNIVQVCEGTACHVRGATSVGEELRRALELPPDVETTPDMEFTVFGVNCVGACALGPVVIANGEYHGHFRANQVGKLVRKLRKKD